MSDLKILIVPATAESYMDYKLQLQDFETESALSGEAALAKLDSFPAQILLVDNELQQMSGLNLARRVRQDRLIPKNIVIILVLTKQKQKNLVKEDYLAFDFCLSPDAAHVHLRDFMPCIRALLQQKSLNLDLLIQIEQGVKERHTSLLRDPLTGLASSRGFQVKLEAFLMHAKTNGQCLSLLLLRIEDLPELKWKLGFDVIEAWILSLAEDLVHLCRTQDFIGRLSENEFVIALPDTSSEQSLVVKERLLKKLRPHSYFEAGQKMIVSLGFGLASYRPESSPDLNSHMLVLCALKEVESNSVPQSLRKTS